MNLEVTRWQPGHDGPAWWHAATTTGVAFHNVITDRTEHWRLTRVVVTGHQDLRAVAAFARDADENVLQSTATVTAELTSAGYQLVATYPWKRTFAAAAGALFPSLPGTAHILTAAHEEHADATDPRAGHTPDNAAHWAWVDSLAMHAQVFTLTDPAARAAALNILAAGYTGTFPDLLDTLRAALKQPAVA